MVYLTIDDANQFLAFLNDLRDMLPALNKVYADVIHHNNDKKGYQFIEGIINYNPNHGVLLIDFSYYNRGRDKIYSGSSELVELSPSQNQEVMKALSRFNPPY